MKILGIYGSPRAGGNTEILLDQALRAASDGETEIGRIRCCDLEISGCTECGSCDATGECIIDDDMQKVYPLLVEADAIILASPIFFYGVTAQTKALIDRTQALWCRSLMEQGDPTKRAEPKGFGYLICVGATKGPNLFAGPELVTKCFLNKSLNLKWGGGLYVPSVDGKGEIKERPSYLRRAYNLGKNVVSNHGKNYSPLGPGPKAPNGPFRRK